jgi:hypothetical protein
MAGGPGVCAAALVVNAHASHTQADRRISV